MSNASLKVRVHIDGGARGNPGPAAAGIVISAADNGTVIYEAGKYLGTATNNQAEYQGLLNGLEAAALLKARQVEVYSDSELLVRQMNGQYRVKNAGLKPLYLRGVELAGKFDSVTFTHVRREKNVLADRLVNRALDMRRDVDTAD